MGVGIAQALKAKGLDQKVKLITFDPSPETLPLFEEGPSMQLSLKILTKWDTVASKCWIKLSKVAKLKIMKGISKFQLQS